MHAGLQAEVEDEVEMEAMPVTKEDFEKLSEGITVDIEATSSAIQLPLEPGTSAEMMAALGTKPIVNIPLFCITNCLENMLNGVLAPLQSVVLSLISNDLWYCQVVVVSICVHCLFRFSSHLYTRGLVVVQLIASGSCG